MSEAKSYTPGNLQRSFRKLQSKHKRAITNFLNAKVSTEDLFAYLWRVQDFNPVAAETWLDRIELENIYYKSDNHSFYDPRQISPVVEVIFDKYPKHPLSIWISARDGYRTAYKSATQNNASYEILDPVSPVASKPTQEAGQPEITPIADDYDHLPASSGLSDPRMRGLAYELGMLQECQLWEICQHLSDSSGKVAISTVRTYYQTHMSDSKFYVVLNSEHAALWFRNIDHESGYIWFKRYDLVAEMLGELVPADRIEHYRGNNAIGGRVHMPLAGTPQTAMQYAFAAWIERRKKAKDVTLANATMATIWGVSVATIKRWKQLCKTHRNYTEQAPKTSKNQVQPPAPRHAINTPSGGKLYQMSSSHTPPGDVQKHGAKGRSTKARKAFYRAAQVAFQADRLSAIWDTEERSSEKRYWSQDDIPQAFKKVERTLRKPTSDAFLPRHVRLASYKTVSVWETYTEACQRVEVAYAS